jgi:hydrogenase maturation protease
MSPTVLVLGYGNPSRFDDGLGPAMADAIEALHLPGVSTDSDYQLTVEDAAAAAKHDVVVFADAAESGDEPFSFVPATPERELSFSTHSVTPGAVLLLAKTAFGASPRGYILGIRGYKFNEFGEGLTEKARMNLNKSIDYIKKIIRNGNWDKPLK